MPDQAVDIAAALKEATELHGRGELAAAEARYEQVVAAQPGHAGAHNLLGLIALQDGRLERAVALFERAAALKPEFWRIHANLGVALRRLGRPEAAAAAYDTALALHPGDAETLNNRGSALLDLARYEDALGSFDAALALNPELAMAHDNRGLALMGLERHDEALAAFDAALARDPGSATARYNRGNALMALSRPGDALESFEAAIAANPGYVEAHNNRAAALVALDRIDEALASLDAAVALGPDNPAVHMGRAETLLNLGRHAQALEGFERALALDPGRRQALDAARWNRALTLLALGRYEAGWAEYESRWLVPGVRDRKVPAELRDRFDPQVAVEGIAGRDVLLVGEQGVGDVLMFASILPDLLAVAGKVRLICEPRLHRLFRHSFPGLEVVGRGALPASDEVVLALGSLGRLWRRRVEDFPGTPYLAATPAARARWAERLGPTSARRRIGISWRGGVATTRRDARSMPLAMLRPLLDLPDCEFVNLQYGDVAAELAAENEGRERPIRDFPPETMKDFDDLAALVQSLDLVVSVQTALVHLSGAVGAPALVMIPRAPEWRYAAQPTTMAWYGSVTLFRQDQDGAWPPVVQRVADEVRRRLCV